METADGGTQMAIDETGLEEEELWDFERAEKQQGRKGRRAIVSVAFDRADFQAVADAARRMGMTTSEFIRRATLEKMRPSIGAGAFTISISAGGTGIAKLYGAPPRTMTLPPTIPLRDSVTAGDVPGGFAESKVSSR
jgi:hypothetical protein